MGDGEGKVTASECRYIVSPGLDVGTPKLHDEIGGGSKKFYTA